MTTPQHPAWRTLTQRPNTKGLSQTLATCAALWALTACNTPDDFIDLYPCPDFCSVAIDASDYQLYDLGPLADAPSHEGLQVTWLQTEQDWQHYSETDPDLYKLHKSGYSFYDGDFNSAVILEWQGPSDQQLTILGGNKFTKDNRVRKLEYQLTAATDEQALSIPHRKLLMLQTDNRNLFDHWTTAPSVAQPYRQQQHVVNDFSAFSANIDQVPLFQVFDDQAILTTWLQQHPYVSPMANVDFSVERLVFLSGRNQWAGNGYNRLALQQVDSDHQQTWVRVQQGKPAGICSAPIMDIASPMAMWVVVDGTDTDIRISREWRLNGMEPGCPGADWFN